MLLCGSFLYLQRAGATLSCSAQASHCGGFSSCRAWALGCVGFSSCDIWAQLLQFPDSRTQAQCLWHTGLVALGHVGSSQTRDPVSPALQADSLPLSQQGSPADRFFITEPALPCPAFRMETYTSLSCWVFWFTAKCPLRHWLPLVEENSLFKVLSPLQLQPNGWSVQWYKDLGPLPRFRTTLKAILSSKTLCRSSWPTYLPWLIPHQDSTSPFNQLYFPYPPTGVLANNICQ